MSTVSLTSHAGRPPPSLVSSSGVLATSPTSLRSPSTFTTVTASGHIPLQPSNFPLLHSLLDSPEYREAMRSNPDLARRSSRRHSKVVNQEVKHSRLSSSFSGGGSTSRAHASKSLVSGSSVAGSIRRPRLSAGIHEAPQQRLSAGEGRQQGRRTLPPLPILPRTSTDPAVPPVSAGPLPPLLGRSTSMSTVPAAPSTIPQLPPTYPSRSFSHDPSLSAPPTRSSFRDAIDKLKRMLRRTHRRRRGRSGTATSVDSLPSGSSMLDLADARSSRTSLMSDLSRLGDMAYVDVVAELERVEPDSTVSQAPKPGRSKHLPSPLAPSSSLEAPKQTGHLEARAPAPSYAARTTDVEAWRESRRQFLLVLEEGPPHSALPSTVPSNSRKTSRAKPSRPSLFQRRRPSFPSFARSQAAVTPFSLDAPLERSRTLDDPASLLEPAASEPNRRYSTYGSRWLEGAELVEVLSSTSGSVQAQEEKRVWRKWRGWVKERAEIDAKRTREGSEGLGGQPVPLTGYES